MSIPVSINANELGASLVVVFPKLLCQGTKKFVDMRSLTHPIPVVWDLPTNQTLHPINLVPEGASLGIP